MPELHRALSAVQRIALASQGDVPLVDVFDRVCSVVAEEFGFDRAYLARFDSETREASTLALVGEARLAIPDRLPVDVAPLFARACESQQLLYVADARSEPGLPGELVAAFGVTS